MWGKITTRCIVIHLILLNGSFSKTSLHYRLNKNILIRVTEAEYV